MNKEVWRQVEGLPIEVSSNGAVMVRGKIFRPTLWSNGYLMVSTTINGARYRETVHRLVCKTFHGPQPSPKHEVAHNDGSRLNNAAYNLRWATRKENLDDTDRHGTRCRGVKQRGAKLNDNLVQQIRECYEGGSATLMEIAKQYGVHHVTVWSVIKRKAWSHVP